MMLQISGGPHWICHPIRRGKDEQFEEEALGSQLGTMTQEVQEDEPEDHVAPGEAGRTTMDHPNSPTKPPIIDMD